MINSSAKVVVSIVSHKHGTMVWELVSQLALFEEVDKIIVTLNIPESSPDKLSEKVLLIQNQSPKGYGENHNAAFNLVYSEYYCVLNPDIQFIENPFPRLISSFSNKLCGLTAPRIIDPQGVGADTMREHLTPWRLLKRIIGLSSGFDMTKISNSHLMPEWVAGMFMLFRTDVFDHIGGFDQRYFMYCEDADICKRIWKKGYSISGCLDVSVIHAAQRASHRNLKHFFWHIQSLLKYFIVHKITISNRVGHK